MGAMEGTMHIENTARSNELTRRSFVRIASVGAASAALFTLPTPALADEIGNQRTFVDSLGRSVTVAAVIENVTPVGVHAQTLMTTLCPEGLVSLAVNVDSDAADYSVEVVTDCQNTLDRLCALKQKADGCAYNDSTNINTLYLELQALVAAGA